MGESLNDKVVLLTGASSGIGWATALELDRLGAKLALAARREDKLRELSGLLKGQALVVPWDVSDAANAASLVGKALERWGRLDVLINNAGVMATASFHEQPLGEIEAVMRTNYLGAAALTQAALKPMLARGQGHVVNVASIAGLMGFPFMASYNASKFALVGLTEALRREYYGTGVTFTAFCPGTVETPMSADALADERVRRFARPKTAEQVARRIARCCEGRPPEVVYGDAPGFVLKLARFIPRTADWLIHHAYKRIHPFARRAAPRREMV